MHRIVMLMLVLSLSFSLAYAGDITLVENYKGGMKLEWKMSSWQVTPAGDYSVVEFAGGSGFYGVGKPGLPAKQVFVEIPKDATPRLVVSNVVMSVEQIEKPVVPTQEPDVDTIGEQDALKRNFIMDAATYASRDAFPARIAEIAYDGILRGRRLLLIRVNPIQYVPATKELRIYKSFQIDVETGSGRAIAETDNLMDPIASAFVLNYKAGQVSRDKAKFLILTVAALKSEADSYAAFKIKKGLDAFVEVLPNNPSVSVVKDAIKKYYPGVAYVMILGDHPLIGLATASRNEHPLGIERCRMLGLEDATVPSDLHYARLEGTDYYPDVYMGRVPANSVAEAQLLLNKLKYYQDKPESGAWRNRFLLCGEFQYQYSKTNTAERLFCETAFTIHNSLGKKFVFPTKTIGTGSSGLGQKEYFFRTAANPNDPTKPGTYRSKIRDANEPVVNCKMPEAWTKNIVSDSEAKTNTLAFWNEGAFLVQHRDHGGETSWGKPSLSKTDVSNLKNGNKLPILFSINCLTGAMDYSSDCFVEAALKNPNGGAAAALGSTRVSYSWWNDRLCDGFYTCIFGTNGYDCLDEGVKLPTNHPFSKKLGVVLNFGKMYLALNYPSNPFGTSYDYTEIEFYLFHCIGDPEMDILID